MGQKTPTRRTVESGAPSQKSVTVKKNSATKWCLRQLVSSILPWIAAAVSAFCSPSGKAGRSLDRLNDWVEGGGDEI
jgi:hypothetical protein